MRLASPATGQIHQAFSLLHLSWSPIYLPAQDFTILTEQEKKKEEEEKVGRGGKSGQGISTFHSQELGDQGQAPGN